MNNISLTSQNIRLSVTGEEKKVKELVLAVRKVEDWKDVAISRPLGRIVYQDKEGNRQEAIPEVEAHTQQNGILTLKGAFEDVDGVTWRIRMAFCAAGPYQIAVSYTLSVDNDAKLLHAEGPNLRAFERDAALFPGLEYLLNDEPSSDTRFAAPKFADRSVPHPYKVTVPLMAVSHEGRAVGLTWDPNQAWGSAWRHPAAVFSSPNRLEEGADDHYMALAAPSVEARWRDEGEREAHEPRGMSPGYPVTLSAKLVAVPEGGVLDILRAWVADHNLPLPPDPGHDIDDNIALCVRSFLDIAWDEEAEGWHHVLSDPWGPRFEPRVANLLWRYGRWAEGDQAWRARAREQVRRAVRKAFENEQGIPLDLALAYGQVPGALDALAESARKQMADQDESGAWLWSPDDVHAIADYKTEDRLSAMGRAQDSSSGFTASRARSVLEYARVTGDPEATESVIKAANWCNTQRRPEGAQTWELHLHVPDVLAVPYLIDINLGAYDLTGDAGYLQEANRWAWTGLPFTYLWNPYYRPIMRYGTIPVFGVTFHDVQSWFGVIVHWNGLVYAHSLLDLAERCPCDGPMDWRRFALGIIRHGMQEQMTDGPYMGMYPDAFSAVKGDEDYTWWLNPQYVAINTFRLGGLNVDAKPMTLRAEGDVTRITSSARIIEARYDPEGITLVLDDAEGVPTHTLIAGAMPEAILCEGQPLERVDDIESVRHGWQRLDAHHATLIKSPGGAATVRCKM